MTDLAEVQRQWGVYYEARKLVQADIEKCAEANKATVAKKKIYNGLVGDQIAVLDSMPDFAGPFAERMYETGFKSKRELERIRGRLGQIKSLTDQRIRDLVNDYGNYTVAMGQLEDEMRKHA